MEDSLQIRDVFSLSEIREKFNNFSEADWIRLGKISDSKCWGLAINGDDLLNEVLCRTLEGKRKCPIDVPVLIFLCRAMESLVSAYLRKRNNDALEQAIVPNTDDADNENTIFDLKPSLDTPDEILHAKQILEKIDQAFSGDEKAQMVLMGQIDDLSPQEIQEIAGLSPVKYASTLRSIRRRLDKLEAEGLFK